MTTSIKTGYAPVNGLDLYHEIRGAGDPLVLLHGGVVGMTMSTRSCPSLPAGGRSSPSTCRATGARPTSTGR